MDKDVWHYPSEKDLAPGIRRFLRILACSPRLESLPVPLGRALMEWGTVFTSPARRPGLMEVLHRPFPGSPAAIRHWEPRASQGPRPMVLFLHGGGWVLGSSRSHRAFCELLADTASCAVYSLDYRRAPEHPYPAAIEDADSAMEWLWEQRRQRGWQNQPLVVAGDSAGGNLATILCRRRRDRGEALPHAQLLFYPVTDFSQRTESYRRYAHGFMLTRPLIDWFFRHYQASGQYEHHDVSPLLCKDLRGLPPTFIALAGCDVLLDEGRAYARSLQAAGVPVQLRVFPDMIHGFINLLIVPEARRAALESIRFLQDIFDQYSSIKEGHSDEHYAQGR